MQIPGRRWVPRWAPARDPSLVALQEAINRFIEHHNQAPRPFTWKADPKAINAAKRGHQTLETIPLGLNGCGLVSDLHPAKGLLLHQEAVDKRHRPR